MLLVKMRFIWLKNNNLLIFVNKSCSKAYIFQTAFTYSNSIIKTQEQGVCKMFDTSKDTRTMLSGIVLVSLQLTLKKRSQILQVILLLTLNR